MIPQITVAELKRKQDAGEPVYLVDVRNYDEHALCRLPDSLLVPLPELPARAEEVEPPAGALVVVYCHHGVRSLRGAAVLRAAGHENAASLSGGIDAWSRLVDPAVPRY
jgi:rhodanese-related sulfurtransferase